MTNLTKDQSKKYQSFLRNGARAINGSGWGQQFGVHQKTVVLINISFKSDTFKNWFNVETQEIGNYDKSNPRLTPMNVFQHIGTVDEKCTYVTGQVACDW